jgi:hypothetical protein
MRHAALGPREFGVACRIALHLRVARFMFMLHLQSKNLQIAFDVIRYPIPNIQCCIGHRT